MHARLLPPLAVHHHPVHVHVDADLPVRGRPTGRL